jgi:phage terminase large subunit
LKSFEGVDVCWCEEAQAITRRSWDILIPTIRKDKSEIWVSFNPQLESDETYRRFVASPPPDCISVEMNHSDNRRFPEVLERERIHAQETMREEDYAHIWEGKCRPAVEGAIYFDAMSKAQTRIMAVPHDPLLKVHTVWDLGWNDKMSILLVQKVASEIRVVDYIEDSHRTYEWYVRELLKRPFTWGTDWIPHDGKAKSAESGRSPKQILEALGRKVEITPDIGVEPGIAAARLMFPRVYFDKDNAAGLFNRLGRYKRRINQSNNEPGAPEHDENSHGADAFRYLAVVEAELVNDTGISDDEYYKAFRRHG